MNKWKYLFWVFLFGTLCTFCEKDDGDTVDICSGFVNNVFKYTFYECTEADSLDCSQKIIESVLLPEQYLECSSTDSLVISCLNYPFMGYIWVYNSIQQGFDRVMNMFNGFDELFDREDANTELIKVYQDMKPEGVYDYSEPAEQGAYMAQFTFIEITLAQYQLINKLQPEETKLLLEVCLDKFYKKSEIPYYSWIGAMSVLAIMGRVLLIQDYQPFIDGLTSVDELNDFLILADFCGLNNIVEITQFIIENVENYLIN